LKDCRKLLDALFQNSSIFKIFKIEMKRSHKTIFFALWFTGLSASIYLTYISYFRDVCSVGSECTKFTPVLGLIWFVFAPIALNLWCIRLVWLILGLTGVIVLVILEIIYNYFCPFCTIAHISGLGMIFISIKSMKFWPVTSNSAD